MKVTMSHVKCTYQCFPPEQGMDAAGLPWGIIDNFEKLGSTTSSPISKYVVSKSPWAGHQIC